MKTFYSDILPLEKIPLNYLPQHRGGRMFEIAEDIDIILSDGYRITLTKGTKTDLISVPGWLWSFVKPIDKAFLGDLIHDWLWINKEGQIKHFGSIYAARKFADEERKKWRLALAPELKFKTLLTHAVIRLIGGFYYSEQFKIPQ